MKTAILLLLNILNIYTSTQTKCNTDLLQKIKPFYDFYQQEKNYGVFFISKKFVTKNCIFGKSLIDNETFWTVQLSFNDPFYSQECNINFFFTFQKKLPKPLKDKNHIYLETKQGNYLDLKFNSNDKRKDTQDCSKLYQYESLKNYGERIENHIKKNKRYIQSSLKKSVKAESQSYANVEEKLKNVMAQQSYATVLFQFYPSLMYREDIFRSLVISYENTFKVFMDQQIEKQKKKVLKQLDDQTSYLSKVKQQMTIQLNNRIQKHMKNKDKKSILANIVPQYGQLLAAGVAELLINEETVDWVLTKSSDIFKFILDNTFGKFWNSVKNLFSQKVQEMKTCDSYLLNQKEIYNDYVKNQYQSVEGLENCMAQELIMHGKSIGHVLLMTLNKHDGFFCDYRLFYGQVGEDFKRTVIKMQLQDEDIPCYENEENIMESVADIYQGDEQSQIDLNDLRTGMFQHDDQFDINDLVNKNMFNKVEVMDLDVIEEMKENPDVVIEESEDSSEEDIQEDKGMIIEYDNQNDNEIIQEENKIIQEENTIHQEENEILTESESSEELDMKTQQIIKRKSVERLKKKIIKQRNKTDLIGQRKRSQLQKIKQNNLDNSSKILI